MVVNYNNGKVYKIVPKSGEDEAYIGSTARKLLCQRMQQHRIQYFRHKNGSGGKITSYELFDKYGVDNCDIVLLELVSCNSKDELHIRERFWIETTNCVNKIIVGRTPKEWYQDNRDQRIQQIKEYDLANRGKKKEYREANRDKNREHQRKYRELHKKRVNDDLEDFFEMFREDENDLGESVF